MDWSRAKSILIFSFLFLNLILGYQLWTNRSEQQQAVVDAAGAIEEIKQLVIAKNIQIPAELPQEVPRVKEIVARFDDSTRFDETVRVATPFRYNSLLNRSSSKDSPAKAAIPNFDLYQFDPLESKSGKYVFHQLYNSLPMFEIKLELFEQNGQIMTYKQGLVEVQSEGEQKEQKVIPAQIALRSLIENYLPEGSVVTSIKLGYHGPVFNSQTIFMVPSWRVAMSDGEFYYVHALNGAVEPPQSSKR
jgi:regulatory protein YycI of two-component signal transduction system YycFG